MSDTGTALKARETPGPLMHLRFAAAQVAGFPGINRCAVQKTALHQSPTIPFGFIFFFKIYHIQGCSENKPAFTIKKSLLQEQAEW